MKRSSLLILLLLITAHFQYAWEGKKPTNRQNTVGNVYQMNGLQTEIITTLSESFEGPVFPPHGWRKYTFNGGTGWDSISAGTSPLPGWNGGYAVPAPRSSGRIMAYCTWSTGAANSNDQWFITPKVSNVQSDYFLRFWMYKFFYYADTLELRLSISGVDSSDFNIIIDTLVFLPSLSDTGWKDYSFNIGNLVPSGSDIYVAFRERVSNNVDDGDFLMLDDVYIGAFTAPGPALVPKPADHATSVDTSLFLKWQNPPWTDSINLYFGTSPDSLLLIYAGEPVSAFQLSELNRATQYYWKVWTKRGDSISEGKIWTFKTKYPTGNTVISLYQSGSINSDSVLFSLDASNFADVGYISLHIQYDSTTLSFRHAKNPINSGLITQSPSPGLITIQYSDSTPISLNSGRLLDLLFDYQGGVTPLNFILPQCELRTTGGTQITVSYNDGHIITGVIGNEENKLPEDFSLLQNYPNPFNPSTVLTFTLPQSCYVRLDIYDITGRKIQTLVNENLQPGTHTAEFNAAGFSSGIYFARLTSGSYAKNIKMLL